MKLKSIRIQNFKSIQDKTFDNLDKLTCISGKSGSGRSSFISAVKFIRKSLLIGVRKALAESNDIGFSLLKECAGKNMIFEINAYEDRRSYTYILEVGEKGLVSESLTFKDIEANKEGVIIDSDKDSSRCISYSPTDYSVLKQYDLEFDGNNTVCGTMGFKVMGLNQISILLKEIFCLSFREIDASIFSRNNGNMANFITSDGWYKDYLYNLKFDSFESYLKIANELIKINPDIESILFDEHGTLYFKYHSMIKNLPFYRVNNSVHVIMAILCLIYSNKFNSIILLDNIDKYLDKNEIRLLLVLIDNCKNNNSVQFIFKDTTEIIKTCLNKLIQQSEIDIEDVNYINLSFNKEHEIVNNEVEL